MPSFFYYITLREKCQTIVFNKKALDKQGVLTYNRDRKSIPVDGLLPLLELRFNRRELVAGAVISFSCRGDSDYYFYDDRKYLDFFEKIWYSIFVTFVIKRKNLMNR